MIFSLVIIQKTLLGLEAFQFSPAKSGRPPPSEDWHNLGTPIHISTYIFYHAMFML